MAAAACFMDHANGIAITQTDAVSFFHINMQFQHRIRRVRVPLHG